MNGSTDENGNSKVVRVSIFGREYKVKTSESSGYVYSLARTLETKITELSESGVSPYAATVMTALSLLDDLNKANTALDVVRSQAKEYVSEAGKARLERDTAVMEAETAKMRAQQLESSLKLKQLGDSIA